MQVSNKKYAVQTKNIECQIDSVLQLQCSIKK